MPGTTQGGEKFIYIIPIPLAARILAGAVALGLLAIFIGIPLEDLGVAGMKEALGGDGPAWAILGGINGSLIAFFIVLAFPPRSWRARVQFGRDHVHLLPRPVFRWIDGAAVELAFGTRVNEILLCHGTRNKSPYGFRIILRALDLPDREIKVETGDNLNSREVRVLTQGITAATGLPVRLVELIADKRGSQREIPWTPAKQSAKWIAAAKMGAAALPVVAGMVIGDLRPKYSVVIIVGFALWTIEALGFYLLSRFSQERPKLSAHNWISSLFNFGFAYTIAFAFLSYLNNGR